jgi:hypothetical protein
VSTTVTEQPLTLPEPAEREAPSPSEAPPAPEHRSTGGGAAWALLGYAAVSVLLFGLPVLLHPSRTYIGLGNGRLGTGMPDPGTFMWFLKWWPYALFHGINPFVTHVVWAPTGFNLTWTTSAPGAALLAAPVTLLWGPVVGYNLLILMAPALAAWGAFLLCRHLTRRTWPSVVGGYVFGFSSYELAHLTAHLNLSMIFALPIAAYLVVRLVDGSMRPRRFAALMTATLLLEFSFSTEVFLTMALFGGLVLLLAFALMPWVRPRLLHAGGWIGIAYLCTAVLVSPYLIYALGHGFPRLFPKWPTTYSTDLANLLVPTRTALFAAHGHQTLAARFVGGLSEQGGYLGILFVAVVAFGVSRWRSQAGKLLMGAFLLAVVCSLGPVLHIGGHASITMPWALTGGIPLVQDALPARFMVYAWLAVAVILAMWLSSPGRRSWIRWTVALLGVALMLPNLASPLWRSQVKTPPFFAQGIYRQYLEPGENTLVIPFGSNGMSMLWQAQANMDFDMAGGYVACIIPPDALQWDIVYTFVTGKLIPNYGEQLEAFIGGVDVRAIVVDPTSPGPWDRLFSILGISPVSVGGVRLWRIPAKQVASYKDIHPKASRADLLSRACA